MSFGFPAYHTEKYSPKIKDENIRETVRKTLEDISWTIREETANKILASTSMNMRSWGEKIHINFLTDGSISVTSKCALPTQCVDWGKNKKNINYLLNNIQSKTNK